MRKSGSVSKECKNTAWGKVINRRRTFSLDLNQFCSKPVGKLASLWSTEDCISLYNLHMETSMGACLCITGIWFNRQIRDNDKYHSLVSLFKENSVANVVKALSPNHPEMSFAICFYGPRPIYHVHWEPLKGRRAAPVPWSRARSRRQAVLVERGKRKVVGKV